jgi:hypothetical protein
MTTTTALTDSRRDLLHRRIRWIVSVTIGYNLVEAVVAIIAGSAASSAALVGFGLDSTIEVLSAVAVAWQFTEKTRKDGRKAPCGLSLWPSSRLRST